MEKEKGTSNKETLPKIEVRKDGVDNHIPVGPGPRSATWSGLGGLPGKKRGAGRPAIGTVTNSQHQHLDGLCHWTPDWDTYETW